MTFVVFVSYIGFAVNYLPMYYFLQVPSQRARALYYALGIFGTSLIYAWLKLAFQDPRPSWVKDEIINFDCISVDYGNPSGHTTLSVSILALLQVDLHSEIKTGADLPSWIKSTIFRVFFFLFSIALVLVIMWTRMVLGVHNLDQLILGIAVGLWAAALFHWIVGESIFIFFKSLDDKNKVNFIKLVIALALFLILSITIYVIMEKNIENEEDWINRIESGLCKDY
jgi:membrane-associated phospholipid phosphatase